MALPTIVQFDERECGPAALAMILAHYGRSVPLEELCAACDVAEQGSRAGRLLQVARYFGLEAKAIRQTAATISATPTPFMAHWQDDHFLVVETVTPDQITLNDPAIGRYPVSPAEFARHFSGVALLFQPPTALLEFPGVPRVPPSSLQDPLIRDLQASIQGAVGWQPYQTGRYAQDFSHLHQRTPRAVVKAVCEEDIIHTLQVARPAGVPVVTRGAGHARRGQSLTQDGILLVNFLDSPRPQCRLVDETHLEVTARTRWSAVETFLSQHGRAIPTMPAYGRLSVGGTLSVGGYGERSIQYGSQIHHVRRLRLILPDGTPVWCSPQENEELFHYSLAGLGQVGVIEKVIIETIPQPAVGEPLYYHYDSPAAFLDNVAHLIGEPAGTTPHYTGYLLKEKGLFSEVRYPLGATPPPPAGATPVSGRPAFRGQDVEDNGYRLAADFLFDLNGLAAYLEFLQEIWRATPLGRYTDWALILAVRAPESGRYFPLEAVPTGHPPLAFLVGCYPVIPLDDPDGLAVVQAIFGRALRYAIELGGRPYLYGSHELDEGMWLSLYGEAYRRLQTLRRQLDPPQLFNAHIL
jgi:FAD/FMN-containing dehydrogenase